MFQMDCEAFLKLVNKAIETGYNLEKHYEEIRLRALAKCITATKEMKYDRT